MSDFVAPHDPAAVEEVLSTALRVIGPDGVLAQLSAVPGLHVVRAKDGGLFRAAVPAQVAHGDRLVRWDPPGPVLIHVVGGICLATDALDPAGVPAALAALVTRAVASSGAADDVSVLLTALRDATAIG